MLIPATPGFLLGACGFRFLIVSSSVRDNQRKQPVAFVSTSTFDIRTCSLPLNCVSCLGQLNDRDRCRRAMVRNMVPDQFAAAESEDGRTPDQACSLLLLLLAESHLTHTCLKACCVGWWLCRCRPDRRGSQTKTNLDDGGEWRKGDLRNSFEMGQIMAF